MTFLAPGFLYVSLAAAAAVVALHFIVMRQPRSSILPTARFVPETRATTIAAARRPSDVALLVLRVITVVAAGAALAKPILQQSRRAQAKVIVVDISRSVGDSIALRDSARVAYSDGDAIVLFDSSARIVRTNALDSLRSLRPTSHRGNLSAALVAALRAASTLRERADSIQLVIVSPFAAEEFDAATDSVRALWPGGARLLQMPSDVQPASSASAARTNASPTDPLATTIALLGARAADSVFLDRSESRQAIASGILIDWPESLQPRGAVARAPIDTIGGVIVGQTTVIAPFERRWSFSPQSLSGSEVIARWVDGEPAAIEQDARNSCVRSVAIPVTPIGDLAIRKDFVELVRVLSGPCAQRAALSPADPAQVSRLAGGRGLAPRSAFTSPADIESPFTRWLLALALLAAIAELLVRRRSRHHVDVSTLSLDPARAA
ncbi:MAG TPA: BatA domain-containing protein [Gemmatimonadaceae bacterium]|nr:BatA domain-containing protein [Gemmatimonadaceae bacterium]